MPSCRYDVNCCGGRHAACWLGRKLHAPPPELIEEIRRRKLKILAALPAAPQEFCPCAGCGIATGFNEFYMVKDRVWAQACGGRHTAYLCIGCLEKRLGKTLSRNDFKKVPLNDPEGPHNKSDRLRRRLAREPGRQ
jgi:hypothetical protein